MSSLRHPWLVPALVLILQGCAGAPTEPPKIERMTAAELEARLRPEEERKGIIAILSRALTPPGDWTGSTGDRR